MTWDDSPDSLVSSRWRAAAVLAGVAFALTLIHAGALVSVVGWSEALNVMLHDPGKMLFHGILLPTGVLLFVTSGMQTILKILWDTQKHVAILVMSLAVLVPVWLTWVVSEQEVCQRPTVALVRECRTAPATALKGCFATDALTCLRSLKAQWNTCKTDCDSVAQDYREVRRHCGDSCDWLAQSSAAGRTSALLSWLGATFAGASLAVLLAVLFIKSTFSKRQWEAMESILLFYTFWLSARAYSEWYAGAGEAALQQYLVTVPAIACVLVAIFIIAIVAARAHPKLKAWLRACGSVTLAAIPVLADVQPQAFSVVASLARMNPHGLLLIDILIILLVLALCVPTRVDVGSAVTGAVEQRNARP